MIVRGRIRVNGKPAKLGHRVDPDKDTVEVDGASVPLKAHLAYYMLNKPVGVVSTASDERNRSTVLDYVPSDERVWPVGRLDIDTEGLLLLTNDGELTVRMTHPRFGISKTYLAQVQGAVSRQAVRRLAEGIDLSDGRTAPAEVRLVDILGRESLIELTIHEGRKRQVRRMLAAVGHPVRRLVRTAVGPLQLGRLRPGTLRRLTVAEVRELYRVCGL
jgi:pseudouridine synthase